MSQQPSRVHGVADRAEPGRASMSLPSPLLDAKAAGELLSVPASWVLGEARADRIPHVRLGRYVRFEAGELEAWWRARARGPWRDRGAAARAARVVTGSDPVAGRRNAA
jgi:hypothetical protein